MRRISIVINVIIVLFAFRLDAEPYEIGRSVDGRPIEVERIGNGKRLALCIVGGIHGNERNTSLLVAALRDRFLKLADGPETAIPDDLSIFFLPSLNPDGLHRTTRRNSNNVDLNRNFPTPDWRRDAASPAVIVRGSGGKKAGSEPCTDAIVRWLLDTVKPDAERVVLVSYHAAVPPNGAVQPGYTEYGKPSTGSDRIAKAIARLLRYPYLSSWKSKHPLTGELIHWCERHGISAIDIELPDKNLPDTTIDNHARMIRSLVSGETLQTR